MTHKIWFLKTMCILDHESRNIFFLLRLLVQIALCNENFVPRKTAIAVHLLCSLVVDSNSLRQKVPLSFIINNNENPFWDKKVRNLYHVLRSFQFKMICLFIYFRYKIDAKIKKKKSPASALMQLHEMSTYRVPQ